METNNINQIAILFKNNDKLYSLIYEYLNQLEVFKYVEIDKYKAFSIYQTRSEINSSNGSKIQGYDKLLNNLRVYNGKKIIISNFNYKNNDITVFISSNLHQILGILNQEKLEIRH